MYTGLGFPGPWQRIPKHLQRRFRKVRTDRTQRQQRLRVGAAPSASGRASLQSMSGHGLAKGGNLLERFFSNGGHGSVRRRIADDKQQKGAFVGGPVQQLVQKTHRTRGVG